jgi:PAS domain S-box-containing protein
LTETQRLLEQEKYRYQILFTAAPDAYLVTDSLGIIKLANRAAVDMLGVPIKRVAGKPMATFFHGETQLTCRSAPH